MASHSTTMYQRAQILTLRKRIAEPRSFIQVISGPRQVGKTTMIKHSGVDYWREGNHEVDFVLQRGSQRIAIEVKTGNTQNLPGIKAFSHLYPSAQLLLVGPQGIPWEEFLRISPEQIM